ncbi:hypothetical protein [Longimicrobium sp.]|jgi:hypothetical protein|uniref:hypothetical protein n=1 Tax=Longimicrobium sp. TaxID=2029185 RepID=UPI002F93955B
MKPDLTHVIPGMRMERRRATDSTVDVDVYEGTHYLGRVSIYRQPDMSPANFDRLARDLEARHG